MADDTDFEVEFNKLAADKDAETGANADPITQPQDDGTIIEGAVDGEQGEASGTEQAGGEGKETPGAKDDPYAGMDEATKARFIAMEKEKNDLAHRLKSDAGRVNAYQRQVDDLKKQITQISQKAGGAQPSKQEITDAMKDGDKWETFKQDYPEVAEALDSRMDAMFNTHRAVIDETLAPVVQERHQKEIVKAYDSVAEVFPTWQAAVKEKDYMDWESKQPAVVRQLGDSDSVADATALLDLYNNYRVANGKPDLRVKDPESNGEGVNVNKGDDLRARRNRQLQDGVTVQSKSARVDPNADTGGEFESAFNAFASRKESQRRA